MSDFPILLTRELKRAILTDGLDALLFGVDRFEDWASNYSSTQEVMVPGENYYVNGFRYFVAQGIGRGFEPFNPRDQPKKVELMLDLLEKE